jgi:hypothetical protein
MTPPIVFERGLFISRPGELAAPHHEGRFHITKTSVPSPPLSRCESADALRFPLEAIRSHWNTRQEDDMYEIIV